MVELQFNKQVKIEMTDNGTEFTCLKNYFLENSISFQTSYMGIAQQNAQVECKHQHI